MTKRPRSLVERRTRISRDIQVTQIFLGRSGVENYRKKYGLYDGRPADNCTRGDVRSGKGATNLLDAYGGGDPAREKPHTHPSRTFTWAIIGGPVQGTHWPLRWRGTEALLRPCRDGISRIPYGVSTAWDKGRVSDAN